MQHILEHIAAVIVLTRVVYLSIDLAGRLIGIRLTQSPLMDLYRCPWSRIRR
jgi:hypothetical protein